MSFLFNSFRWKLLGWYTAILCLVLGLFIATLFHQASLATLKQVDADLVTLSQFLNRELEQDAAGRVGFEQPPEILQHFIQMAKPASYARVWDAKGRLLFSVPDSDPPPTPPVKRGTRHHGSYREIHLSGLNDTSILVGRNIETEQGNLQKDLREMLVIGVGLLILALGGGWFLTERVLTPIQRITRTASAISASNLSQRIDTGNTEREFGALVRTLNHTFDRLEQAFGRQTRFTADASHELRTPVAIILTQAEAVLKKNRSAQEYRETVEICLKVAHRMKSTVEGLLTLARADAGELRLDTQSVNLAILTQEIVTLLQPLALERQVAFTLNIEPTIVNGDRERFREAITNLATNAIRYNRTGGKVTITLRNEPPSAILAVSNTGPGIPTEHQAHIFERFYRVDQARAREAGGSGLGLAITKWIVEAHGGTVTLHGREGEATTFTIRLPLNEVSRAE